MATNAFNLDFSLANQFLGNQTPLLRPGPIGRLRLVQALSDQYGPSFRTLPGPQAVMADFDSQTQKIAAAMKYIEQAKGSFNQMQNPATEAENILSADEAEKLINAPSEEIV
jgi:hypothetical protein